MPHRDTRETTGIGGLALRTGRRYYAARDMVLSGEVEGWQDESGRWRVSVASIDAWLERRASSADVNPQAAA